MNERIRELYQQAHSTRYYDNDPSLEGNPPTVYWQGETSAQRFAELIVRECAEVAANVVVEHEGVDFGLVEACYKHFGVEQ